MKSILKSKTFWFNLLSGVTTIAGLIPANPITLAVVAVGNIVLRAITTAPVTIPIISPNAPIVKVTNIADYKR